MTAPRIVVEPCPVCSSPAEWSNGCERCLWSGRIYRPTFAENPRSVAGEFLERMGAIEAAYMMLENLYERAHLLPVGLDPEMITTVSVHLREAWQDRMELNPGPEERL